jgi:hypothetical protein
MTGTVAKFNTYALFAPPPLYVAKATAYTLFAPPPVIVAKATAYTGFLPKVPQIGKQTAYVGMFPIGTATRRRQMFVKLGGYREPQPRGTLSELA